MDTASEAKLQLVHPQLAGKVRQMADQLALSGVTIKVTQGLRSWNEQLAIWQKGRDSDGNVVDSKAVVTHAAPGHSWHNLGLAVDVAPFADNTPDWSLNHPVWKRIEAVGESLGMVAGAEFRSFPDWPHFQLTGVFPVSPNDEVRQIFKEGGISAVWNESGLQEDV
jgi:peptidoglycan L-alanyl-D-glutamate endopeptidase CwlK